MSRGRLGRLLLVCTCAGSIAVGLTWMAVELQREPPAATTPSEATPAVVSTATPPETEVPLPTPRVAPTRGTAPVRERIEGAGVPRSVEVRALGLQAPVVPIRSQGPLLVPPDDPTVLGWWSGGAVAGAARGSALVTGHTVHDGGGALDDLELVPMGSTIVVRTDRGRLTYRATSVEVVGKEALARRAPQLFSRDVPGRLVLVTCEDWNGTGYESNVVVKAELA